jgi:quercetin dioxygenase-like cupin family protein
VFVVRRFAVVVALVLLGVGSVAGMSGQRTLAEEATPVPGSGMGISYQPLGYLPALALPESSDTEIGRGTLEPGAGFEFGINDPASGLLIVESGEITVVVEDASWTVSRGAAVSSIVTGTPAPGGETEVVEIVEKGEEATFTEGDIAFIPGSVTGALHNSGDEQAVALLITYTPVQP